MTTSTALSAAMLENDRLRFDLRVPSSSDTACGMDGRDVVIFDLGGVLIDWNPRHLYRKLFDGDEAAMEHFLATVCSQEWNRGQDAGRLVADAARLLKQQHAGQAELIDAFYGRFDEMMAGPISGTVDILAELHARGTPLYLLSNFAAETYPLACRRFDFLRLFHGIIVSGEVKAIKPDPRIYEILIDRYRIDPRRAIFIDDVAENVDAAQRLGIYGIQFTDPEALRAELAMLKLL